LKKREMSKMEPAGNPGIALAPNHPQNPEKEGKSAPLTRARSAFSYQRASACIGGQLAVSRPPSRRGSLVKGLK